MKIFISLIILLTANLCPAQSDTVEVDLKLANNKTAKYNTSDFEITYELFSKYKLIKNKDTVYVRKTDILSEYNNTLFLSGNSIVIPESGNKIALDNLREIKFYKGRYGWTGFGIGAAVGFFAALAHGDMTLKGDSRFGLMVYPFLGAVVGAVTGGLIGVVIRDTESFVFKNMDVSRKREEMVKLLLKHKRAD